MKKLTMTVRLTFIDSVVGDTPLYMKDWYAEKEAEAIRILQEDHTRVFPTKEKHRSPRGNAVSG